MFWKNGLSIGRGSRNQAISSSRPSIVIFSSPSSTRQMVQFGPVDGVLSVWRAKRSSKTLVCHSLLFAPVQLSKLLCKPAAPAALNEEINRRLQSPAAVQIFAFANPAIQLRDSF